jgi:hypothetical protein
MMWPARGILLPAAANFIFTPRRFSEFSESSPEPAYKSFSHALPYLRHMSVMLRRPGW